ncbi:uncharacterized protein LOC126737995 [Anthonomus grandis grandis]|uniref:uncharacterized protein LOC126737995 n=1 Tax=Anthonomus grandis grandis TaxID=2921223 RepID=UPI002165DC6B|nr:uncharacterized protein LOC126737995 [Anthonomus grandis grandis]
MDAEKLINAIKIAKKINQQNKGYRDRDKVEKLWQEVAAELNVSKEAAKKRWKSLRDVFRNELKKLPKPKSGDETPSNFSSKWTYFKILWFLKDQMTPRQLTGNLPTDDNASQLNEDVSNDHLFPDDFDDETSVTPDERIESEQLLSDHNNQTIATSSSDKNVRQEPTDCGHPPKRPAKRAAKRKEDFDIEEFLKLEQQKIDVLKANNSVLSTQSQITQDDDYHFLMSFHAPLKKMRFETKMWFRLKMQELLYQATVNAHHVENISFANSSASNDTHFCGNTIGFTRLFHRNK